MLGLLGYDVRHDFGHRHRVGHTTIASQKVPLHANVLKLEGIDSARASR